MSVGLMDHAHLQVWPGRRPVISLQKELDPHATMKLKDKSHHDTKCGLNRTDMPSFPISSLERKGAFTARSRFAGSYETS